MSNALASLHDPAICVDCLAGMEDFHAPNYPSPTNQELHAHMERVRLCVTMLAAVMAAMAASPFGAMIPQDIRDEIDRVTSL